MSIDYDHLREWLDTVDRANPMPGDTIEFSHPGSTVEIVRELLRLRDGVEKVRDALILADGLIAGYGFGTPGRDLTNLLGGGDE